jgi:nicotinamidase-related amidase
LKQLPIPSFFNPSRVGEDPWRVDYLALADEAEKWRAQHQISLAAGDDPKIKLMLIDVQNTFCLPGFELYVGGQSGTGAVDDNVRICKFIYQNLPYITQIAATMDTHWPQQIFHPVFWIDANGNHPPPATMISVQDVENGTWKVNPAIANFVAGGNLPYLVKHALHYVKTLADGGKYALTIWPYHAMLGGIGHALVSSVHEALFFHDLVRKAGTHYEVKGGNLLTENYSVIAPEVTKQWNGEALGNVNDRFYDNLINHDYVIIAGQAKSHCVAWTIDDILKRIKSQDPALAKKIYLLEDCTSPVVIPGVIDFTDQGNEAFDKFKAEGMNVVKSTDPMDTWPGMRL